MWFVVVLIVDFVVPVVLVVVSFFFVNTTGAKAQRRVLFGRWGRWNVVDDDDVVFDGAIAFGCVCECGKRREVS